MTSPKPSRKNKADFAPNNKTFRLLFTNHPIPMWVYDLETLAFLDVNDAALKKYGYTRDEFLKLTIKDIRPAEDVERLIDNLEQKRPSLQNSGGWRHCLKNGQVIKVEITSHTLDFEGHKAALVMAQDITERKHMEDALRESEEKFKNFFEYSNVGKSITLLSGGMSANQALCDLVGYTQAEFQNKKWQEITHPDDIELTQKIIDELISGEQNSARFNKRYIHKNGYTISGDVSTSLRRDKDGKPLYLMTSVIDITEQKRAGEALRESEERFHLIFEKHDAIMLLIEPQTGLILDANQAAMKFYGYTKTKLNEMSINEINTLPSEQVAAERQKALHDERNYFVFSHRLVNGEERIVEVHSTPISFQKKQVLFSIIHDITERKRTEEALKESEKRFATIFRANPAAIAMTRLDDGYLVDINAAWQRLIGYVHTEVVGHTAQELNLWVNPEQRDRLVEMLGNQGKAHGEIQLRHKSGDIRDLLMSADLIELTGKRYMVTMAQDITESKRADKEITASNRKWQTTFNGINDAVFLLDGDGLILQANKASVDLFGKKWEEMAGKHCYEVVHNDTSHIEGCPFVQMKQSKQREMMGLQIGKKWFEVTVDPLLDGDGHLQGAVHIVHDITERKQMEDALCQSESLLAEAQRIGKLGHAEWIADRDELICSNEMLRIFELSVDSRTISRISIGERVHPEDKKHLAEMDRKFFTEHSDLDYEYRLLLSDNKVRWIHQQAKILYDENGKPIRMIGVFQDITEHKLAEESLRETAMKLVRSQQIGKLGSWDWSIAENSLDWSDEVYQIWGVGKDFDLTFENIARMIHPDDQELNSKMVREFLTQSDENGFEFRIICPDGTIKHIYQSIEVMRAPDGQPIKMFGIMQDITKRKQTEEALVVRLISNLT
jgi:PAS domain S-box-containing protein